MFQLLDIAKNFLNNAQIKEDGVLVDFTMGNGHDTLYMCSLVPKGTVYAFDIQKEALENTQARLCDAGVTAKTILIHDTHENSPQYIDGEIDGGMFNLGYLPGGDKSVHTKHQSTLRAVKNAVNMLKKGGVLVISVYPGHAEGKTEGETLLDMLSQYDKKLYGISRFHMVNSFDAPFIIAVERFDK